MIDNKIDYDISIEENKSELLTSQSARNALVDKLVRKNIDTSVNDSGSIIVELYNAETPINRLTYEVISNPINITLVKCEFFMTAPTRDELGNIIDYGRPTL